MITDIQERLIPNEDVPSGQCPHCQGLTYQLADERVPPNEDTGRGIPLISINTPAICKSLVQHKNYYEDESVEAAYRMLSEEMGELLVAMSHHRRGRHTEEKVIEEIADVMLLCRLAVYLFNKEDLVETIMTQKAQRFGTRTLEWMQQAETGGGE